MDQSVNKALAIKYFDGFCAPGEVALIDQWLKVPGNERQLEQWLWEDWKETKGFMPESDALKLKWKMDQQILPVLQAPVRNLKQRWHYKVAAAAILILVMTGVVFLQGENDHKIAGNNITAYTDSIVNNKQIPFKAVLADGSTVWLNNGATLYIASGFNRNERRVKLTGEAFFEIKKDASRPFYTEAGNLITHVLGTTYNVEAYPAEKEVRVSLMSGRIAVYSADTNCIVSPGQMVFCSRHTGDLLLGTIPTSDPSAWIKGKIVMNKIALPEALDRLSRLYHTSIQYDPNLIKEKYITGEFDRDTLPVVLQSILFVHNLKSNLSQNGGYIISGDHNKK